MSTDISNLDLKKIKQKSQESENDEIEEKRGDSKVLIQPIQEGAKSSVDVVELPTGYLEDDGQTLHTSVDLKELTGEEEDILTSRNMPMHVRMNKILENCVTRIGDHENKSLSWASVIRSLVVTDRLHLLLKIRILSLGPLFSAKCECANEDCKYISNQTVDLNDFVIEGLKDPYKRQWSGVLPKSKWSYTAKSQTGREEAKLAKHSQSKDLMSLAILGRLVELNGKEKISLQTIKKLSLIDRQHLRKEFADQEGDIIKNIEYECPDCGHENKQEVDIATTNFFFPTET